MNKKKIEYVMNKVDDEEQIKMFFAILKKLNKAVGKMKFDDLNDFLFSISAVLTFVGYNIKEHHLEGMEDAFMKILSASIHGTEPSALIPKIEEKPQPKVSDVMFR